MAGEQRPARHILFTLTGNGANCWTTYPADMARAVSPDILTGNDERWWWQPISYGAAGINGVPGQVPAAFPMQPSIDDGVREFTRLLKTYQPGQTFAVIAYSEGAIVFADMLDRMGITSSGTPDPSLTPYAEGFLGGVTFGNPRREKGHTLPGGIDPGGHGIVRPNLKGTPDSIWEMAAGKNMPGSPGQDLYTTSGYDGDTFTEDDEAAIWEIVRTGTLTSVLPLATQLGKILTQPLQGGLGAGVAILDALNFFVLTGLTPHTSYQFTHPIPGDPRDCWAIGLQHIIDLGLQHQPRNNIAAAPAPAPIVVPVSTAPVAVPTPVPPVVNPVPAPVPTPVAPAPAPTTPAPVQVPAPVTPATPTPTNGNQVNQVNAALAFLKSLPAIVKALVSVLTVAGAVVGSVETVVPATSAGTTAIVASSAGLIAGLIHFLSNPKTQEVIDEVSKL